MEKDKDKIKLDQRVLDIIKGEIGEAGFLKDFIEDAREKASKEIKAERDNLIKGFASDFQREKQNASKSNKRRAAELIMGLCTKAQKPHKLDEYLKGVGDERLTKAMGEATGAAGGFLIAPDYGEMIEDYMANSVVRQLGAEVLPLPNGSMWLPADGSRPTSSWVGESSNAASSSAGVAGITLSAKKMMTVVPVSNELLGDSSGKALQYIERKMQESAELKEDLSFLRSDGGEYEPMGLLSRVYSDNKFDITHSAATATAAEIEADLLKAIYKLALQDVPMLRGGWAMHPRIKWKLFGLRDANGNLIYKDELKEGMLYGMKVATTTQIPITLDTSGDGASDETDIYLVDAADLVIGEVPGSMELEVIKGAAYYDSTSAAVVSGLSRDETVVVLKRRLDFNTYHQGKSVAIIRECDWA